MLSMGGFWCNIDFVTSCYHSTASKRLSRGSAMCACYNICHFHFTAFLFVFFSIFYTLVSVWISNGHSVSSLFYVEPRLSLTGSTKLSTTLPKTIFLKILDWLSSPHRYYTAVSQIAQPLRRSSRHESKSLRGKQCCDWALWQIQWDLKEKSVCLQQNNLKENKKANSNNAVRKSFQSELGRIHLISHVNVMNINKAGTVSKGVSIIQEGEV